MSAAASPDRVTAIVVTFNSAHCLPDLAACFAAWPHVVVVDNASTDATVGEVRRLLPGAQLIQNRSNLGFGAANNRAVRAATTEFVLLINPDCSLDGTALARLVDCADRFASASLIGPQLTDAKGSVDLSYGPGRTGWSARGPAAEGPLCVGFVSGACMLIRTAAMHRIGGFDESFFLYYEDDDLCLRLQRECGPLIVEPTARAVHRSRSSVAGPARLHGEYLRGYHHIQSKLHFHRKHLGAAVPAWRRVGYLAVAVAEAVLRLALLDRRRAARVWGRAIGVFRYARPR